MRVGIVAKRGAPRAIELADELATALAEADVTVAVDEATREALAGDGTAGGEEREHEPPPGVPTERFAAYDLVISVGGDGTFLYAARGAQTTPVLGVNIGEVGFLNAISPSDAVEATLDAVEDIRERGQPTTMTIPRLVAEGPDWTLEPAVNEVALLGSRRGHGGGVDVEVAIDGAEYTAGHADGLLVATPVGSTAYNLSEGGPLVHPTIQALVVTPMAGLGTRPPIVVDADSRVTVALSGASEVVAVADGTRRRAAEPPVTIEVGLADDPLSIAEPSVDYFAALSKLD